MYVEMSECGLLPSRYIIINTSDSASTKPSQALLFYRIQLHAYLSFKRLWSDFVIVLRYGWRGAIDYVM